MTVQTTDFRSPATPGELLDGLNPQQRAAVLHQGAPLLIVAGAGSGKTAVLTRRIAHLLAARDVGTGQILAAVQRRTEVSQAIGKVRMASGGTRLVHSREMKVIERYSALGQDGKDLAMLLLRMGRGRLGQP